MQAHRLQHWSSNTLAAAGARAVAARSYAATASQQQQQQQQTQQQAAPPPPPKWSLDPLAVLAFLPERQSPYLQPGAPPACKGSSMAVQLHVGQTPLRRGLTRQKQDQDICTLLFREGLQRPNSTPTWAGVHQHSQGVFTVSVQDSAAAQAAAAAAVAAGRLEVGEFVVPVSWARSMPPAGSIAMTIHQLPPEYARKGCVTALLQAAGQEGTVVCEFLGGSSWMGNAALSCPAADSVVAWVQPPAHDRLLTHLPSSFQVPGRAPVQIQVAGRPSLAPHLWLPLNQQQARLLQAALEAVDAAITEPTGQQASGNAPPPPQLQQPARQQQQAQRQTQQRQQQPDGSDDHGDVVMRQAAPLPPPPPPQQQQQQQQQQLHTQPQEQLQHQQLADTEMASGEQQPRHPADRLPSDPFATEGSEAAWQQLQVEQMLQDAEQIADEAPDPSARQLSAAAKQQLQQAFLGRFSSMLHTQTAPPERAVRSWLRQQLGVPDLSYGSDSDDELELPAAAASGGQPEQAAGTGDAEPQGQQQRRDQRSSSATKQRRSKQQAAPTRHSPRDTLGQMSDGFRTLYGPTGSSAATTARKQRGGGKGRETAQLLEGTMAPLTPAAAAAPPRRARGRAGGSAR